jgi:hypothetical protein
MISFKVSAQESKPVKSQTAVLESNFSGLLVLRANNPL